MSAEVRVRPEAPEDRDAIRRVHVAAFPTPAEANLVDALRESGKAVLSLVAEFGGEIVGHVLFSPVRVILGRFIGSDVTIEAHGLGLAPVAVLPAFQRQGIGAMLIQGGLSHCRRQDVGLVVVLGVPEYYSRFGFAKASTWKLRNEYGVDEPFMVLELKPYGIPSNGGLVKYAEEFSQL
jgi:putative acetyltransferase